MRFLVLGCLAVFLCLAMPQRGFAEEAVGEPITQEQIETNMFTGKKSACALDFKLFAVTLIQYKRGITVNEYVDVKVLQPFVEKVYKKIQKDGVTNSMLDSMKTYQKCSETAEPELNQAFEAKKAEFFQSCGGINAIALATLDGLQKKQKQEVIEEKLNGITLNVKDTMFEKQEEPEKFIVQKIYESGKNGNFDAAVENGYNMVSGCFVTKK